LAVSDPSGWKQFTNGQVLPANEIRGYLQQGVLVFDNAGQRDSTLVGFLREGMVAYTKDTDTVSYYDGSTWNVITGQIAFASEAARDAAIPNPVDGRYAFTTDLNRLWLRTSGAWVQQSAPGIANFSDAATGTYTDGGISYKYLTFNASGTLTVTKAGFADVLVIGGGAGGGRSQSSLGAGGGGAGGYLYVVDAFLPVGTLTVTVGAGGPAYLLNQTGRPGNTSGVGSYYSSGGGGGGAANFGNGENGGSGGGAGGSDVNLTGGSGVSGLGNSGGNNASSTNAGGGGGGDAAGSAGSGTTGGAGGAGVANSITGTSVTRAGGGGGAGSASAGSGGAGGGGAGASSGSATAGTANTGGGGGGAGNNATAAGGGSGVVIIRVKV
jgi:hypothetical protein